MEYSGVRIAALRLLRGARPRVPVRRIGHDHFGGHSADSELAAALTAVGRTLDRDGRWRPPAGVVPPDRYSVIAALATGRDLTRAEMIDILLAAGYRESSATGRLSSCHPLFRRTGPDRYRLVGDS